MSKLNAKEIDYTLSVAQNLIGVQKAVIFSIMRTLKQTNPGDAYLENYLGHFNRDPKNFYDMYMLLWEIGANIAPRRILEIGTRTGISLCQLLSSYIEPDYHGMAILSVDPFNDGYISPALVKKNLKALGLEKMPVTFFTGKSDDWFKSVFEQDGMNPQFDLIIVDGDHDKEAACRDLINARSVLAPGGIIVFDDISKFGCDLIDVWERFEDMYPEDFEFERRMEGKGVAWAINLLEKSHD